VFILFFIVILQINLYSSSHSFEENILHRKEYIYILGEKSNDRLAVICFISVMMCGVR
jgi:hypothetical protein